MPVSNAVKHCFDEGQLSAGILPESYAPSMSSSLESFADRAWYAWHCLPRGKKGRPPTQRKLSLEYDIPIGTLSKVFDGTRKDVERATIKKMAAALQVSEQWLYLGQGIPPQLTGPLPPRPGAEEPEPPSGTQSGGKRLGDLPGWDEAEAVARKKEQNRDGWSFRGARELVVPNPPHALTAEYVLYRARIFRAEATPEQKDAMERLEIAEEKAQSRRVADRAAKGRR